MRLRAIFANVHVYDGPPQVRTPLRFRLSFSDGSFIRLRGSSDASTMILDDLPLDAPFDMENYGRVEMCDFTAEIDPSLGDTEIGQPRIVQTADGRTVGLALPR